MCALALLIAEVGRRFSNYSEYWVDSSFEYDPDVPQVVLGFLLNGYFPIFPWILYPLAGYVTAAHVLPESKLELPRWRAAAAIGAVLFSASFVPSLLASIEPRTAAWFPAQWTMFPASIVYVLRTLGTCLVGFSLGHRWLDRNPKIDLGPRVASFFGTFSRHSLTIYLLHHLLHLWPLWIWAVSEGKSPTSYWRPAMPIEYAMPLAILCLIFCYLLMREADRRRIEGVEGWMRWLCD